jgi:hypothetical protein
VQIVPGSLIALSLEGTTRVIALLNEMPLFVFDGDLLWSENKTPILSDEMCDQTFLVKRKFDSNILKYIRPALDVPNPTGDRQMGIQ